MSDLLTTIHDGCENSITTGKKYLIKGKYEYYHYMCDRFDDRGWGCGYRTLQTICSWMNNNFNNGMKVPSIKEIQEILVEMEDKPASFVGSRQWIGSFEVCLVLDKLYDVSCKILHVSKENKLEDVVDQLQTHFEVFGAPVMMGGDIDCSSKGIMGINVSEQNVQLLVVDPHYHGPEKSKEYYQNASWVKWMPLSEFLESSFYNLCLPQVKSVQ